MPTQALNLGQLQELFTHIKTLKESGNTYTTAQIDAIKERARAAGMRAAQQDDEWQTGARIGWMMEESSKFAEDIRALIMTYKDLVVAYEEAKDELFSGG